MFCVCVCLCEASKAQYLAGEPLLKDGIEPGETSHPGQNVISKGLGKGRGAHGPALDDVVIKQGLSLIQGSTPQDVGACGLPLSQLKVELLPVSMHLVQGLFNGPLPAGLLADLFNGLYPYTIFASVYASDCALQEVFVIGLYH